MLKFWRCFKKKNSELINDHYSHDNLSHKILSTFEHVGKNNNALTTEDIKLCDEYYIRNSKATSELARLANLREGMKVLDLGCGIGSLARTLAAEYGCHVQGLDLVEEYCRTADILTNRMDLSDRVSFQHGNVLDTPFEDASFDIVWTQHLNMNIENKTKLYHEIHRVLRPAGNFVLYEFCAGLVSPPYFPVSWASNSKINFLVTPDELRQHIKEAGFTELMWKDVTFLSLEWFREMIGSMGANKERTLPQLGPNLLIDKTMVEKVVNLTLNLKEDRIREVQGVLELTKY